MRFNDFLPRESHITNLVALTKREAIAEMVEKLATLGHLSAGQQPGVLAALLERERIRTTAIGDGVAIPHARYPGVRQMMGIFARSAAGLPFDAPDGKPVTLLFMLLCSSTESHLEALTFLSRVLQDRLFRNFLEKASTSGDIQKILDSADAQT